VCVRSLYPTDEQNKAGEKYMKVRELIDWLLDQELDAKVYVISSEKTNTYYCMEKYFYAEFDGKTNFSYDEKNNELFLGLDSPC